MHPVAFTKPHYVWFLILGLTSAAFALTPPARAALEPFDLEDYFLLDQNSAWHYRGDGQPGSSSEDNFTWTVLEELKAVSGGVEATRILTTTDEGDDDREDDEDFWAYDAEGNLFFHGFHNGVADGNGAFPVQDVILEDPLRVGGRGMRIGDVTTDTVTGTVLANIPIIGLTEVAGTLVSKVTYVEFIPVFDTGLGPLTDVLLLTVEITGSASYKPPIGPELKVDIPVRTSKFYLKDGWSMVGHDQAADLNDAERQVVDLVRVAGVQLEAPPLVRFDVSLNDPQPAVRGARRAATGSAQVTVDTVANTYSYSIAVSGLSSDETGASINGFLAGGLGDAPTLHDLPAGSPKTGTWNFTEEQQHGILAGLTYIVVRTESDPDGELRGQITGGTIPTTAAGGRAGNWTLY